MANRAAKTILHVLVKFKEGLDAASDNKGIQFKINSDDRWKANTIGLRCNHVFLESTPAYIERMIKELANQQAFPLLDHISISTAYTVDSLTTRKRHVPWKKNIFITLRPHLEVYEHVMEKLPGAVNHYTDLPRLFEALEEL
jgi:hypothetical protein